MRPFHASSGRRQDGWRTGWWALGARAVLVTLAVLVAALVSGAPGALAAAPCGTNGVLTPGGTTASCTYKTAGEDTFTVPAGVTSLDVTAVGAGGAMVATHAGGAGARVENPALPVTSGMTLFVDVGAPGAIPTHGAPDGGTAGSGGGGGGGGSSALLRGSRAGASLTGNVSSDARLLVAGGGGGAGTGFAGGNGSGTGTNGGAGNGTTGTGGDGGVGPTNAAAPNFPSCGGAGGGSTGVAGSATSGGNASPTTGAGAGGGGWCGGGGGSGTGGGGGGSSYGGTGQPVITTATGESPVVVISWNVARPTASISTPANGATYTQGQAVASSFTCAEAVGGPGLATCEDQNGRASGAAIDTSTVGTQIFTVVAVSKNGLTGTASVTYTVTAACPDTNAAFNQGFNAGFNPGFNAGFNPGFKAGFNRGFHVGFGRAADVSHALAPRQALPPACDAAFNAGFNAGFNPGFNSGFNRGFNVGFNPGFNAGFRARHHRR